MYYNPESRKTAFKEDLMVQFNASIPELTEEFNGWHLVDEQILYPHLKENQIAIPENIKFYKGNYAQTYSIKQVNPIVDASIKAKYTRLENAFIELAQIVTNFEEYRILSKIDNESLEHSVQ